jgi:hypothetical protein
VHAPDDPDRGLPVRRVITAETSDGKGVIARVEDVTSIRSPADRIVYRVWGSDRPPALPVTPADVAAGFPDTGFPGDEGGYRVRIMTFAPDDPDASHHEERGQVIGSRLREIDLESGLHATDSVDIAVVISGEITLVEDDGAEITLRPWDVLVQNGTRHVWRNRSGEPCTIALIILAAPYGSA